MKKILTLVCFLSFGTSVTYSQYCSASGNSTWEWIERVSFAFDKKQTGNDGGYLDALADVPMHASLGMCFSMDMEPGFSGYAYNEYWGVWIDYNQDGDFDDIHEEVYLSTSPTNSNVGFQMHVPNTVKDGWTRMRVAMKYGSAPSPCGTFTYGEVEDYTFYIEDGMYSCENNTGNTFYEWIDGVGVGDLNLFNGNNDGFYVDYCQSYTGNLGDMIAVTITPGFSSGSYDVLMKAWIDTNNDNDFSDAGEALGDPFKSSGSAVTYEYYLDPSIEPDISHRLRVQLTYFDNEICEYVTWGEVEEYVIYITDTNNLHTLSDPIAASTRQKHNDGDPRQQNSQKINIYPNPANAFTTIDFGTDEVQRSAKLELVDMNGRTILKEVKKENTSQVKMDLGNVASGAYFIRLEYQDKMEMHPITVIQK